MNHAPLFQRVFLWKKFSSFAYLNASQFLVTLNDGIFRLLVAYSLIDKLGTSQSSHILFVSGVLFVIPFLIFSMPAGDLADKYPKHKVLVWTMAAEVIVVGFGVFAIYSGSTAQAYIALFLIALQASVFNPVKYSVLPEIVKAEEISKVNGILTLTTYMAIILGTFLASFITQITGNDYTLVALFCLFMACLGFWAGIQIEKTEAKNPEKRINPLFLAEVYKSLRLARQYPHLLLAVLGSSYFLFSASFTQLNLIPFGIQSLKITDVQTGYIFLAAALGIGIGSTIVATISGDRVNLGISICGAIGTFISYFVIFGFKNNIFVIILMILSLGIHGGLYIVPLDAWIQITSPEKDRGEIVAAGTFLGFIGVLCAALSIGLFNELLKISAAQGFLIVGILTFFVTLIIIFSLPEFFISLVISLLFGSFFTVSSSLPGQYAGKRPVFFCPKYSFLSYLVLLRLYPNISFIHFVDKKPSLIKRFFYRFTHKMPYEASSNTPPIEKIFQEKNPTKVFCLPETEKPILRKILKNHEKEIFPIHIERISPDRFFKILPVRMKAFLGKRETT